MICISTNLMANVSSGFCPLDNHLEENLVVHYLVLIEALFLVAAVGQSYGFIASCNIQDS